VGEKERRLGPLPHAAKKKKKTGTWGEGKGKKARRGGRGAGDGGGGGSVTIPGPLVCQKGELTTYMFVQQSILAKKKKGE